MDRKFLVQQFLDAYNCFDVAAMVELVAPDIEFSNVCGGEIGVTAVGLDEFRDLTEQSADLFSSRKQTPTRFDVEGDAVTVEIDFVGSLATDIQNGKAGDSMQVSGRSEYVFRDDKISRLTDYS